MNVDCGCRGRGRVQGARAGALRHKLPLRRGVQPHRVADVEQQRNGYRRREVQMIRISPGEPAKQEHLAAQQRQRAKHALDNRASRLHPTESKGVKKKEKKAYCEKREQQKMMMEIGENGVQRDKQILWARSRGCSAPELCQGGSMRGPETERPRACRHGRRVVPQPSTPPTSLTTRAPPRRAAAPKSARQGRPPEARAMPPPGQHESWAPAPERRPRPSASAARRRCMHCMRPWPPTAAPTAGCGLAW